MTVADCQELDLFDHAALKGRCGECVHLDPRPINPDVHYCRRHLVWRKASERVPCPNWSAA